MSGLASAPPVVQAWIAQLLDPAFLALMAAADLDGQGGTAAQVDVRLSSSNGKVRFRPAIVLNGGQQSMVEPLTMLTQLRTATAGQRQQP